MSRGKLKASVWSKARLRAALLAWYRAQARALPWRAPPGAPPMTPYRVWLSEIMLQQTTVAAVQPYFLRFLELFPNVESLAGAPLERVLEAFAGLGYYSRARRLHEAAQLLAKHGFPRDEAGWRALPGVGDYTAAAVAAIAFGLPANPVDGNIERVMARLYAVETPLPGAKAALAALAAELVDSQDASDWPQALMDLGAGVCTPRAPSCPVCPWRTPCAARQAGLAEVLPRRAPKPEKERIFGVAFHLQRGEERWLVRRPLPGLLGGMAALPSTPWRGEPWGEAEALTHAPWRARWREAGVVRHVFTHRRLELRVLSAEAKAGESPKGAGWWGDAAGLPSLFRKAVALTPINAREQS